MRKNFYPDEKGKNVINDHKMEWKFKRSKGESAFGIKGSRIFELELKKDGVVTGFYDKGWTTRIKDEDTESKLCLEHILNTFGKEKKKERSD